MTKEESIAFLQSCIDKIKNASEEEIEEWKNIYETHKKDDEAHDKEEHIASPYYCIVRYIRLSIDLVEIEVSLSSAGELGAFGIGQMWRYIVNMSDNIEIEARRCVGGALYPMPEKQFDIIDKYPVIKNFVLKRYTDKDTLISFKYDPSTYNIFDIDAKE